MMKSIVLLFFGILFSNQIIAQCSLSGNVIDEETNEGLPFANVAVYQNGVLVTGVMTGFEGEFCFEKVVPGVYEVEISYVGYPNEKMEGVTIVDGESRKLDFSMRSAVVCCCWIVPYNPPLIEMDAFESGMTFHLDKKGLIKQ